MPDKKPTVDELALAVQVLTAVEEQQKRAAEQDRVQRAYVQKELLKVLRVQQMQRQEILRLLAHGNWCEKEIDRVERDRLIDVARLDEKIDSLPSAMQMLWCDNKN